MGSLEPGRLSWACSSSRQPVCRLQEGLKNLPDVKSPRQFSFSLTDLALHAELWPSNLSCLVWFMLFLECVTSRQTESTDGRQAAKAVLDKASKMKIVVRAGQVCAEGLS